MVPHTQWWMSMQAHLELRAILAMVYCRLDSYILEHCTSLQHCTCACMPCRQALPADLLNYTPLFAVANVCYTKNVTCATLHTCISA